MNGGQGRKCTVRRDQLERKSLRWRAIMICISGRLEAQIGIISMKEKIGIFFDHVESIAGKAGVFFPIDENPKIVVAQYQDVPESGCLTAFSFGLSVAGHKEWRNGRPELMISMDSGDSAWALAMGEAIRNGWSNCLFSHGNILNFGQKISDESDMSAFLVYACSVLDSSDVRVDVGEWSINISQLYPIHSLEIPLIKKIGAEKFFNDFDIDFFDPRRVPLVLV